MKAVILNNLSFVLAEGEAPYFIKKEDFLNFLTDKEALQEFVKRTPAELRAISPIQDEIGLNKDLGVTLGNNYERLGFYEQFNS